MWGHFPGFSGFFDVHSIEGLEPTYARDRLVDLHILVGRAHPMGAHFYCFVFCYSCEDLFQFFWGLPGAHQPEGLQTSHTPPPARFSVRLGRMSTTNMNLFPPEGTQDWAFMLNRCIFALFM